MKRKGIAILICLSMIMSILLTACGGGSTTTQSSTAASGGSAAPSQAGGSTEVFEFKMASIATPQETGTLALDYLAEILEERSGGRIKATHYGNKALAQSDTELGELVRQNSVQLVPIPTHTLSAMANVPQYKVFEFPYLFTDWEEIYKVLDSDMAKEWAKALESEAGVTVYGGIVKGWLSIGTKKGPVNDPAVLKGQKIRTMATDMQMALISAFGGSPTVVAYGEVYTAAQQGTIDGMMTATGLFESDKFAEVIDHLAVVRATAHFHIPTVNKAWVDSLPDDLRVIFDECIEDFLQYQRANEKANDERVMTALKDDFGVEVLQYSEAELAPFKAAVKAMWEENYNLPGEGVMDSVFEMLGKDYNTLLS